MFLLISPVGLEFVTFAGFELRPFYEAAVIRLGYSGRYPRNGGNDDIVYLRGRDHLTGAPYHSDFITFKPTIIILNVYFISRSVGFLTTLSSADKSIVLKIVGKFLKKTFLILIRVVLNRVRGLKEAFIKKNCLIRQHIVCFEMCILIRVGLADLLVLRTIFLTTPLRRFISGV